MKKHSDSWKRQFVQNPLHPPKYFFELTTIKEMTQQKEKKPRPM